MSSATRLISPTILIPALFTLICSYVVIGGIVNYRKLRQFKGPPLAGISRAWLFYQEVRARSNKAQYAAIEKYGECHAYTSLLHVANLTPKARRLALAPTYLLRTMQISFDT